MKSCCKEAIQKDEVEEVATPTFLQRLQKKWNAKTVLQVILIISTFAIAGSLCGYLGRTFMKQFEIAHPVVSVILHIVVTTIIWPFCIILISIPFGQFAFFKKYLSRMGNRIIGRKANAK